jgi:hypothetical protein
MVIAGQAGQKLGHEERKLVCHINANGLFSSQPESPLKSYRNHRRFEEGIGLSSGLRRSSSFSKNRAPQGTSSRLAQMEAVSSSSELDSMLANIAFVSLAFNDAGMRSQVLP